MSSIFGGSQSNSSFNTNPLNLQNPAYIGLAPSVAQSLQGIFGGGPAFTGIGSAFGPNVSQPSGSINASNNPLVAGLTPQQTNLVNQVGTQAMATPQQGQANTALSRFLDPSFLNVSQNPNVQGAVQAAVNPIQFSFANQAIPSMISQFTQAGQATPSSGNFMPGGNPAGTTTTPDSSAFQKAAGMAQTGEAQAEATAASNIELPAYEQAVQEQQAAVGQAAAIPAQLISSTVQALQASALPEMIQQYGINQALQLFQQRIQTMMTALGLGGQVSQPALAASSSGGATGSSTPDLLSGIGNFGTGLAKLFSTPTDSSGGNIFSTLFGP